MARTGEAEHVKQAEAASSKSSPKKRRLAQLLAIAGIVVVAALAGAGFRWWQLDQAAKKAAAPTVVEQKVFDSQDKVAAGDFDTAQKQLAEALDNSHLSSDERYKLTAQQGTTYENQKNYKEAIKKYQAAEAIKQTQDIAESIGRAAAADGDKALAIAAYKRAMTRINEASNPVAQSDVDRYSQLIRSLGGQP